MAGIIPAGAGLTGISKLPMWQIRNHPRGCRAHTYDANTSARVWGSSPRVRGSLSIYLLPLCWRGIIPAGAGLTRSSCRCSVQGRDHPRGCGAHCNTSNLISVLEGSSPRVRGSRKIINTVFPQAGIIPAGAGLTRPSRRLSRNERDHPRGCGAHKMRASRQLSMRGSSPRVRGSLFPILND